MFGKIVVGKALVGLAVAGVLSGVLATGALAAPATAGASHAPKSAKPARAPRKDLFSGTVTAISDTQLTLRNRSGVSKTFLRDDATRVYRGKTLASWSEIEINSRVALRSAERNGKTYAVRIQLGLAHDSGRVTNVDGNVITLRTRDGKDVKVTVSSNTKIFELVSKGDRKAASLKDIHAGERLSAAGAWDKNGNLDAALVIFHEAGSSKTAQQ